jgi:glycolate oxidase iron-sulfur subunit
MQTRFSAERLGDPEIAAAEQILRKCVHCGFCTATCPTYVLLGDELDSPRGRIYLIKEMLENERPATAEVVRHVDRCLSCLACMTTCPSGVHYQHLVDHARAHIERTYRRPWPDRALRAVLARVLPYPRRFRAAIGLAALARPFARALPARLRTMLALARRSPGARHQCQALVPGTGRMRVALLEGCVQSVLAPGINRATERLLARIGVETVAIPGCCGAIVHHLGRDDEGRAFAAALIERLCAAHAERALDAVVVTASGCGTQLKDYAYLFRNDAALADKAALVSALARDVTELVQPTDLPAATIPAGLRVAYHSACSMQHGQRVHAAPRALLEHAGFAVAEIGEGHLCCGSAGTYNVLEPELAARLGQRKADNIARTGARIVATGNIGCITQLAPRSPLPVLHTVELLDWATGGPKPSAVP